MKKLASQVHRWDIWSCELDGPAQGNPFLEQSVTAVFTHQSEKKTVNGFYDGDGHYEVRFMPSFEGEYTYSVQGSWRDAPVEGTFTALPAQENNHGPVRVANQYHFAYEDGMPYYSVGTTCYVWNLQSDDMVAQTLETLKNSCFNKIRFCVFPKHYDYNLREPYSYPFEGTPMDSSILTRENFRQYDGCAEGNDWDFTRFNPTHFQRLEKCVGALRELGIEADIILFHPYDRWGFSCMTAEQDAYYLNNVIARLSAYRNVWWSLANEYDLMTAKTISDWEGIAQVICRNDPYQHLRSIHNCRPHYDHTRPWITHCSIQRQDLYKTGELVDAWRMRYGKPVVMDEIAYEGTIEFGWGNLTGEEMTRRCWETVVRGGYPGHSETVLNTTPYLWWSHGGKLFGESEKRLGFLLDVMKETPGTGLRFWEGSQWDECCGVPERMADLMTDKKSYYLCYYSFMRPSFREFHIDEDTAYEVTVLDTWNMTRESRGVHKGKFRVDLPARPYMAIQLKRVD